MKKIISIIPLLLSLLLACDVLNGVYNDTWTDRQVPVFKTGTNTTAYTPVTGEDWHDDMQWGSRWPIQRFTDHGDTITDNNTGLMWTKNANLPAGTRTWNNALAYIQDLNNNIVSNNTGYSDWRLPNIRELASLLNYGEEFPGVWLANQGFTNFPAIANYWSSTTDANNSGFAYYIIGSTGIIESVDKAVATDRYVWPVRGRKFDLRSRLLATGQTTSYASGDDGAYQMGEDIPYQRFYDNGDGTMTDRKTNLMWTKNANLNGVRIWSGVHTYISGTINVTTKPGGYSDWRLPNVEELKTLIHFGKPSTADWLKNEQGFINLPAGAIRYWTSTTYANDPNSQAWVVNMHAGSNGKVQGLLKADPYYVWPVRGGER